MTTYGFLDMQLTTRRHSASVFIYYSNSTLHGSVAIIIFDTFGMGPQNCGAQCPKDLNLTLLGGYEVKLLNRCMWYI